MFDKRLFSLSVAFHYISKPGCESDCICNLIEIDESILFLECPAGEESQGQRWLMSTHQNYAHKR